MAASNPPGERPSNNYIVKLRRRQRLRQNLDCVLAAVGFVSFLFKFIIAKFLYSTYAQKTRMYCSLPLFFLFFILRKCVCVCESREGVKVGGGLVLGFVPGLQYSPFRTPP